jgi:hypothetical protein
MVHFVYSSESTENWSYFSVSRSPIIVGKEHLSPPVPPLPPALCALPQRLSHHTDAVERCVLVVKPFRSIDFKYEIDGLLPK